MRLADMDAATLQGFRQQQEQAYAAFKAKGMKLNMARGKPSPEQLDLSMGMHGALTEYRDSNGEDLRNYGSNLGIPELRAMFGQIMGVPAEQVFVGGSASLSFMFDCLTLAYIHGVSADSTPWSQQGKIKFLCPVPGYDRHFTVSDYFGVENVPVPMTDEGPDMDVVEQLVAADPSIKGMWCVPQYSNPSGVVYSDAVVRRLAALRPAAADFRLFWDNAYAVHHLYPEKAQHLADLYAECVKQGNEDLAYYFASSSKITLASAGVAAVGLSQRNFDWMKKYLNVRSIGFDRMNQLRHLRYMKDMPTLEQHMAKHAAILRPKFETVLSHLETELAELDIATWSKPQGGYFVCFAGPEHTAKRIVSLCKEAGVVLTGAGAPFPYGQDPLDNVIRIAPSFPPVAELEQAMELFCIAVKLAAAEQLLSNH